MKFWPARTKHLEPVADLDAILSEPVPFKFMGKIHELKPLTTATFLKYTNAQATLMARLKDPENKISPDELIESYHAVVSTFCDTISAKDIKKMEQVQIAALYQLITDLVTGQVNTGDVKKKRKRIDLYSYAEPSSSQSAPENSAGQQSKH